MTTSGQLVHIGQSDIFLDSIDVPPCSRALDVSVHRPCPQRHRRAPCACRRMSPTSSRMPRRAPRADGRRPMNARSLTALLAVLTLASCARPQRAWVLWSLGSIIGTYPTELRKDQPWQAVEGWPTRTECDVDRAI